MEIASGSRPRCSVFIALSVDGFIARPDGAIDWLSRVQSASEDYGYAQFASSVDVLVIGRSTYETALSFDAWPYAGLRCVVLTHRAASARYGEEFFAGSAEDLVAKLSREGAKRVYVDGGRVIQQFLAAKLIDDLTLSMVPVVLGRGIRLFGADGPEQALSLIGSRCFSSGLVQVSYRAHESNESI